MLPLLSRNRSYRVLTEIKEIFERYGKELDHPDHIEDVRGYSERVAAMSRDVLHALRAPEPDHIKMTGFDPVAEILEKQGPVIFAPVARSFMDMRVLWAALGTDHPMRVIQRGDALADMPGYVRVIEAERAYFVIPRSDVPKLFKQGKIPGVTTLQQAYEYASERNRAALEKATVDLQQTRHSVVMFPEGATMPPGRFAPFRRGIAILAEGAKVPVIPVAIENTAKMFPPHFSVLRYLLSGIGLGHQPVIHFGKPILPSEFPPTLEGIRFMIETGCKQIALANDV